jgi:WD40 repeat protein
LGNGVGRIFDYESGELLVESKAGGQSSAVWGADFDSSGEFVLWPDEVSAGSGVTMSHIDSRREVGEYLVEGSYLIPCAAWSSRGFFAVGDAGGEVTLWVPDQQEPVAVGEGMKKNVISMDFDPSGELLAAGGYDNVVKLWRIETSE